MVIFVVISATFFLQLSFVVIHIFPKSTFIKLSNDVQFAVLSFKMTRIRIFSRRTREDTGEDPE